MQGVKSPMKLSERIKEYRKINNLTQTELAEKLFVTKQAISKWENDLSFPDVSMYPELSKLLNTSIDDLMENKFIKPKKNKQKLGIIILLSMFILISLTAVVSTIIYKNKNSELNLLIKDVEANIGTTLPKTEAYEFVDFKNLSIMNSWYPSNVYYFIFKDGPKLDTFKKYLEGNFKNTLNKDLINILPDNTKKYLETCDWFLITTNKEVLNEVPENYGVYEISFYAYQTETNRLIVQTFEYEVK